MEVHGYGNVAPESPTFTALSDSDRARLDAQRSIVLGALKEKYGISGDCSIVTGNIVFHFAHCEALLLFVDALGPVRHVAYRLRYAG